MTTESEMLDLLARRFTEPEWAFFRHVPDATGLAHARTADAVAMNLYPSKGLEVHGFEVKCSRADLIRELRHPEKADAVQRFCDRFWLVVPSHGIYVSLNVPETWGIMVEGQVMRRAPLLSPLPLSREFVASLLRQASRGQFAVTR